MRSLFIALLLFTCHGTALAQDSDTPESRRAQAVRYLDVSNIDKMMADMTTAMTQNLAPAQAADVKDLITRHVRMDALKEAMIIVMVKHFTTRELAAMADFYGSPEGKSVLTKFGAYSADIMPMVQAEIQRAAESAKAEKAGKPGA